MKFFKMGSRFFGIFIFVVSIFITILFAEGYQFDSKTHGLVKKSVLFFEGIKAPEGASIRARLDGKEVPYAMPLELRVAPGVHEVDFSGKPSPDAGWKKRIVVPEESVVRFPEIQLVPASGNIFAKTIEPIGSLARHSGSQEGVFFIHPALHFGKFYSLEHPDTAWIENIPFFSKNLRLIPFSEDFWFGITADGKLFSYDTTLRQPTPRAEFAVQDARLFEETLFLLDREGKIWKLGSPSTTFRGKVVLGEDDLEPQFLFRVISPISHIRRIEAARGRMMFLFDRLVVVAQDDGALLFQEPDVESASLDGESVVYMKRAVGSRTAGDLVRFDLIGKKVISAILLQEPIRFVSRIGESYQFLFLTAGLELFMCDPDYENCRALGKTSSDRVEASKDRLRFFIEREETLTLLDFEESGALPPFLENLVSFARNAKISE